MGFVSKIFGGGGDKAAVQDKRLREGDRTVLN